MNNYTLNFDYIEDGIIVFELLHPYAYDVSNCGTIQLSQLKD